MGISSIFECRDFLGVEALLASPGPDCLSEKKICVYKLIGQRDLRCSGSQGRNYFISGMYAIG
jgi:hypothetical protein